MEDENLLHLLLQTIPGFHGIAGDPAFRQRFCATLQCYDQRQEPKAEKLHCWGRLRTLFRPGLHGPWSNMLQFLLDIYARCESKHLSKISCKAVTMKHSLRLRICSFEFSTYKLKDSLFDRSMTLSLWIAERCWNHLPKPRLVTRMWFPQSDFRLCWQSSVTLDKGNLQLVE